jgi:hypothetical protein
LAQDALLTFNGIDGSTGEYLQAPVPASQVARLARGEALDNAHLADLKNRRNREAEVHFGVIEGVDPKNLAETGWGVIFAEGADPAIQDALRPLLDLRRSQAEAKREGLYREFKGPEAYRTGETKPAFLDRHGAGGAGAVDPSKVPYYLLIVGSPEAIPFRFQYQLDVQYAVGRLHFDSVEEYARYAESVVRSETGKAPVRKRASFFGVANPDDIATSLSSVHLVQPLAEYAAKDQASWTVDSVLGEGANKSRLASMLHGPDRPALLFTATHGVGMPMGHSRQAIATGGLVCQDWQGPLWKGKFGADLYFSAEDVSSDANVAGMIAMIFACYGGGCPKLNDFAVADGALERKTLAGEAFISALPKRLLSHPKGGALAVIAHVDRAWGYSFHWKKSGRQLQVFQSALKRLMEDHPVGSALEYFNSRYAELSADLSSELEEIKHGKRPDDYELSGMWTSNNDARNYMVIGDPAVRVPLQKENQMTSNEPDVTVVVTTSAQPQPAVAQSEVQFGFFDPIKDAQEKLTTTLNDILEKLGTSLQRTLDSVTTLEVTTYTSDDVSKVRYEAGEFKGANLRAMTRVTLTGETKACIPVSDGKIDEALWKLHSDMVEKAVAHRTAMWKTAAEMAAQIVGGMKR